MAELGLAVAQTLFVALQYSEVKEICSIWGYKSQLEDLEKTVITVKSVLKDADSKLELSYEQRGYIKELKAVVYEADDLFDEFVTLLELKQLRGSLSKGHRFFEKVRHFFFSNESKFCQAYRMYHKVKEIQTKLNAIVDNHKKFALDVDSKPICLRKEETCSYIDVKDIIGRDDDKKAIIDKLLEPKDQDVCFLTIVGVGGLGKTALAQLVYNDEDIQREFWDFRFWVCVSDHDKQQFDVKAILAKILKLVTQGQRSFDAFELEQLQKEFRKELGGKKYMLVLDDVWNEDREKWVELQRFIKIGRGGSRVLVTTRSEMTAIIIGDDQHTHRLQGLSPENSWDLFKMVAFNQGNHQQKEFLEIGENIVAKCFNIPLAIKIVGSLLYGQDISQWRLFEENDLADIRKGDNKIMSVLKLSYHNLETSLKSCFTYCAVFPKGSRVSRERWIKLWMAQGYIVPAHGGQSIEEAAKEHFLILLRRCFFQDVEKDKYGDVKSVKVHDLMHDVAQEVAGEEIQILYSGANNIRGEVCHLSFAAGRNCLQSSSIPAKLRSYIHICSPEPNWGEHVVLNNLKYLRVLDLKYLTDVKSHESIGELLHLRYLNLSHNNFVALPSSITKLHNLQTLILRHSHQLRELPTDLSKLEKLRHLDISKLSNLTCIPSGMDKLTSLKVLTDFVVGKRVHPIGKDCDEELKDLESLTNLTGRINICICQNYRNVKRPMSGSYLSQMKHLKKVVIIFWGECADPEAIMKKLEPHQNLKVLRLELYHGQTIPWWRKVEKNDIMSLNLVHIKITECSNLLTMPSFSKMPYLKSLELVYLDKLEYMEETTTSTSHAEAKETRFFPSLESLWIYSVPKLKGWFGGAGLASAHRCLSRGFPRLSHLKIECCDNLASFPPCPSVKTLHCEKSGILKQVVGRGNGPLYLDTLIIKRNTELKSLSELSTVFMSCASSLRSLTIDCPQHESIGISEGLEHLTALEMLSISGNHFLRYSEDDIMSSWKSLHQSLHTLELSSLHENKSLPKGMQYLTSLRRLKILHCPSLNALPEWISCLSSLQYLEISECSRILKERCSEPNGADWQKIQHIPNIAIGNLYFR